MGNNSGKEAQKGTETPSTGIPEIQQAEQKARQAAEAIRNDPTVKKVEEKGKQAIEAIKHAHPVQEAQDKAKKVIDEARHSAQVQKVEDQAKDLANKSLEKAKEITEKAKEGINIAEIEGKAKDTIKDITNTLSTLTRDSSAFLHDAEKHSKHYYGIVREEVRNINRDAPVYITNFKRDHIFPIDPTVRAAGFYGLTALTFLISIKARAGFFSAVRNTAFVGLTSGFFIHPESLNPFRCDDESTEL